MFASDRNGLFDGEEHTNFKLNTGGEYLALVADDGVTITSEFSPGFPPLAQYVSYGRVLGGETLSMLKTATPNAPNSAAAPIAKVLSLTASDLIVAGGADVTLSWTSENADTVELYAAVTGPTLNFSSIGTFPANGSITRNPAVNRTYRIRAVNAYGSHDAMIAIAVGPQVLSLEARPTTIASGGSTVLSWETTGSDVTLGINGVPVTGASGQKLMPLTGAPAADTLVPVTITATNASGTVSETINITVLAENTALPPLPPLVVSEFYWSYNGTFLWEPYRFFEFHNLGTAALDLDGFQLYGSKYFQFSNADPRVLAPDGIALVISDPASFAETWPGERPVIGVFANPEMYEEYIWELEQTLLDPYGRVIEHFAADRPLPNANIFNPAQRIDENAPPDYPENWTIVEENYNGNGSGTPGEANFQIVKFAFNPPAASPGETVMIEWETPRAVPMTISGGTGVVSGPSGSLPITVPLDATELELELTATTTFSSFSQIARLTLPPTIRDFWSTKTAITRGEEITLHWSLRSGRSLSTGISPDAPSGSSPLTFTPLISGFPVGSLWKYLPNGNGQGPEWRDPAFDDRSWGYGLGIFGYGNDIETTVLQPGDWVTAYFRRHFTTDEIGEVESLEVDLLVDDGAEVYLNGSEVLREMLPEGEIDFNTRSTGPSPNDGREYRTFALDPSALVEGDNVIAVGAHNNIPNAEDFEFDLGLRAIKAVPASGRKNYTLTASNPAGTSSATVTILFEEKTEIADWRTTHGLVGDPVLTDSDLDGLTDIIEFAIGSDPLAYTPPPVSIELDENGKLLVRFPRHLSRADINFRAETSSDLQIWQPMRNDFVLESSVAPEGSSVAEVVHRSYAPASGERYVRLVVSLIP